MEGVGIHEASVFFHTVANPASLCERDVIQCYFTITFLFNSAFDNNLWAKAIFGEIIFESNRWTQLFPL